MHAGASVHAFCYICLRECMSGLTDLACTQLVTERGTQDSRVVEQRRRAAEKQAKEGEEGHVDAQVESVNPDHAREG